MTQRKDNRKNIFVLNLDDTHLQDLEQIPDRNRFRFHGLLGPEEQTKREDYDINDALMRAEEQLNAFDGTIDAIIGYWDFPVTAMAAILCGKFSLPSPSLEAVLKCAHKYWSRMEQRRHIPEATPNFCAINPFCSDPFENVTLEFPFWVKPICGYSSFLGFRINNRDDFDYAMEAARKSIRRIGTPFNSVLSKIDTSDLNGVDGNYMIAEEFMRGIELAPEGYVQNGEVHFHGVVDMVRASNHKSFQAYRYPSIQNQSVQEYCQEVTAKLIQGIGYDNGCFNVEYFWHQEEEKLRIIEVNARVSQSHSNLMAKVDGMSNYEVAIHVGVGDTPQFERGGGAFNIAAKYLYHHFDQEDARCVAAPGKQDLAQIRKLQPETLVSIEVHQGDRLSESAEHDSYSWLLAELIIGGEDVADLNRKYEQAVALLPFEFEPVTDSDPE